ncbi:DEAD/DEAH box helicase [Asticcacaulis excentricus]|uniref:DEAD/DEAH box helicase n=1 Tax=Asticcacaulis excentricus TaxID=78587 RepID=UPI0001A77F38|nr:hypothetical protein [Asticcacaulis excentricus]
MQSRRRLCRPFRHQVAFRNTAFRAQRTAPEEKLSIQELYKQLAADQGRNDLIFNDILEALENGRSPVVITERKDHLLQMAERLGKFARNVIVLHGGMGIRQHRAIAAKLAEIAPSEERVIMATGRYLGEGFDDPRLDTLFLTMPISWRGTLAQYAGRLHRLYAGKTNVRIYDYRDHHESVLSRMAQKRELGYKTLVMKLERRFYDFYDIDTETELDLGQRPLSRAWRNVAVDRGNSDKVPRCLAARQERRPTTKRATRGIKLS